MPRYEPALYDESDPLYAPLTSKVKGYTYWRAPASLRKLGAEGKPVRLTGTEKEIAAEARRRTRDLLRRFGLEEEQAVPPGTWHWMIHRYRTDEFSPYQEVKGNTRQGYDFTLDRWDAAIGHLAIRAMDYATIKTTEIAMKEKGRSVSYVSRMMNTLRRLANYGAAIGHEDAKMVAFTLSQMKFRLPPARTSAATREQVRQIVDAADAAGLHGFACGILLQWVFSLRAVDVRGQWLDDAGEGGIRRGGKVWRDGLTWDMFDPDLTSFTKVISKTERSLPTEFRFDLTPCPEIRSRLRLMRGAPGPVILSARGEPYTTNGWSHAWSRLRAECKLPETLWMMDTRSGAITEGSEVVADPTILRDFAGHMQTSTTNRYLRGREKNMAKVVELREARRNRS